MPSSPCTFIFDLDNVLFDYDLAARLEHLSHLTGLSPQAIRARLWDSGFEDAADAGQWADGQSYLAEFVRRLGHPLSREQWIEARRVSMTPRPEMLALVERLKSAGEVALLTNNVPLLAEALADICPEVPELFGARVFFSCHMRLAKPDPAIYLAVCRALGRAPGAALFIDDKAENAAGATRAGLAGLHFTGHGALIGALALLGISA